MNAWIINNFNGIEGLRLDQLPEPSPAPGEVVLDVRYAALNPADYYLAAGQYPAKPPMPHVLGRDGLGTVREVGPNVTSLSAGDRVCILRGETGVTRWGTFAQRVAVAAESLVPVPEGWTEPEAAGAPLVYLTAYQALTQWPDLPQQAVVLVTGASGGVGVATVQLGRAMGHTVLALSRDPKKSAKLRELGAEATFDPNDPNWHRKVKDHLAPTSRRVDLAIDNVAGPGFSQLIDTLGDHGRVGVVGQLAGPVPQFSPATLFFRRLKIGGVFVGAYTTTESRAAWREVMNLLERLGAKPLVDRVFPFDQLPAAFARLKQGPMGKVLLEVQRPE